MPPRNEVCAYANDLPTRLVNNLKLSSFTVVLFYLVLFLGAKLIINAVTATLLSDTLPYDFFSDLTIFPPFAIFLKTIPALGGLFTTTNQPTSNVVMPYLRDYCDITLMIIASMHMTLIHKQWIRISGAASTLWKDKVLNRDVLGETGYQELIKDANKWFGQKRWNYTALVISAVVIVLIYLSFARWGIYSSLSRAVEGTDTTWEQLAYSGWWSNPANTGWLPLLYSAMVYFVFLYYVLLHNIAGVGTVRLLTRLVKKHIVGTGKSLLTPQPYHADGFCGLQVIRVIMTHVYLSLLMTGFAILMMYYYVPLRVTMVVLPFVGLYLFAIVAYVAIPLYLLHRDLTHARESVLEDARVRLGTLDNSISRTLSSLDTLPSSAPDLSPQLQLRQYYLERYRCCLQIPTALFSFKRWVIFIFAYLIPVFGILLQLPKK